MANITHPYAVDLTQSPFLEGSSGMEVRAITLSVSEDNLNTGDVWNLIKLPANAIIFGIDMIVDDLDEGTSLIIDIGHDDSSDAFLDGSDAGQAGGTDSADSGLPFFPQADASTITATCQAGAGTAAEGEVTFLIRYAYVNDDNAYSA